MYSVAILYIIDRYHSCSVIAAACFSKFRGKSLLLYGGHQKHLVVVMRDRIFISKRFSSSFSFSESIFERR